jgi:endonuclease/exonuclease/phosphatase family metal-dependent hydrolase
MPPPRALDTKWLRWEYRSKLLLQKVRELDADVLCLQEVGFADAMVKTRELKADDKVSLSLCVFCCSLGGPLRRFLESR